MNENEPCQTCLGHGVIDDPDARWWWPRWIRCPECAVTISRAEYDRLHLIEQRNRLLESLHVGENFVERHFV